MQQIPGYPTDLTSSLPTHRVTVDGVELDASTVSVTRALASYLPPQVAVGGTIMAATGDVEWAAGSLSVTRTPHPWSPSIAPPVAAGAVTVDMGYGGAMSRQLTGIIDSTSGALVSGDVSSGLIDGFDRLSNPVTIPPLASQMPPLTESLPYRSIILHSSYHVDRVLRACGFYATPAMEPGCVLSAPLMGSTWPEKGTLVASTPSATVGGSMFAVSPWGLGADFLDTEYQPDFTAGGNGSLTNTMRVVFLARPGQNNIIWVNWDNTADSVQIISDRYVVKINIISSPGGTVTAVQIPWGDIPDEELFTCVLTPQGQAIIHAGTTKTVTGTYTVPAKLTTNPLDYVSITAETDSDEGLLGGVQIAFNNNTGPSTFQRTAFLDVVTGDGYYDATPAIINRDAAGLLKEWAEAECAAMFLDEYDRFHWISRHKLTASEPAADITALDGFEDLEWESNSQHVRSQVVITQRIPSVSVSSYSNITFYQGNGDTFEPGQEAVEFISVPADEDWIAADVTAETINFPESKAIAAVKRFNTGQGTWVGGSLTDKDNTFYTWPNPSTVSASVEQLDPSTLLYKLDAYGLSSSHRLVTTTLVEGTSLLSRFRDYNLPIIRGMGKVKWRDRTAYSQLRGPTTAQTLAHDCGWRVQSAGDAGDLANWLASQVIEPRPVIRNLRIIPDHRLQLADVVTISDPDNMGIRLTVLIIGDNKTQGPGTAEQSITCQVIRVENLWPTLTDHDVVWVDDTLTAHDAALAGKTLAAHDAAPLART